MLVVWHGNCNSIDITKKSNAMQFLDTTYITASESIDTILLDNETLVYVHYKHGYASIIESLQSLLAFLDGDVNARWMCVEDNEEAVDAVLQELSEKRV